MMSGDDMTCRYCGMLIPAEAFASKEGIYCSEGCFLKEKQFHAVELERDNAYLSLVEALAAALDIRERETGLHSKRVACHTLVLARLFTDDAEKLRQVYWGSLLHDIGKIGIRDAVLLKQAPLNDAEWEEMRKHPELGHSIVSVAPFMNKAAEIVLRHEERCDGSGYPDGLAGEAIPWEARLFSVIDALDAMTSDRPYRKGWPFDKAKTEILSMAGSQFDPEAVDAFLSEEETLRGMVAFKGGGAPVDKLFIK